MIPTKPNPEADKYKGYFYIACCIALFAMFLCGVMLWQCSHLESRIDYWRNLALHATWESK